MRNRIPKQQVDLLGNVPLFSACSKSELRSIAQLGTPLSPAAGTVLTKQGAPGREFFLVLDGTASCKVGRREVRRFSAGDYFGEMALLHGGYRNATVAAATPMDVLVLDAREFQAMLMSSPRIGVKMLGRLAQRLEESDARYTD
jgi:CRP-like cAMP-binding protein